ncbi:MAG: 5-methyltetrahydropteroyltriglutamate--homocysteine methyltransferase [Candidatus Binatota bacterium]|nr:5-methyltetrahydropteroyltriglutamate--homocysteine methyltransferase [Candidatus Binatota bacterium]
MRTSDLNNIRIDHIGSMVRPAGLKDLFARYDRGQASREELAKAQDEAIRNVVQQQEAHGLPVVTDGEFRRHSFQESFSECVTGFDVPKSVSLYYEKRDLNETPLERAEQNFDEAGPAIVTRRGAAERLKLVRNLPLEEFRYGQSVANVPAKVTVLGPDRIAQRFKWEASLNVYKGLDDFVEHVVEIERQLIAALVAAGCKYIQIDAPGYTAYVDQVSLERMRSRGEDPERNFQRSIDADNALIEGFPDVTFGIHICRGNARTIDPKTGKLVPQWHREGSYDAIAEKLFNTLKHQRLLLEYDSDRAGGFEPLRLVPKDKIVVLGLVSTKNSDMETVDELKRRIDQASKFLPIDQLALSPQCGFGGIDSKVLSEDEMWKKLDTIVETASKTWK